MNPEPEQESSPSECTPQARLYLTIVEFAKLTGISVPTLRRRMKDGTLRAIQPGGPGTKAMFRRDALEHAFVPASSPEIPTEGARPQPPPRKPVSRSGPKPAWQRR